MEKTYFVYLLASRRNGTLYIGVTNDLVRRVAEHRSHLVPGFTSKYNVTRLMWYEMHGSIEAAITREKQIKAWHRAWKIELFRDLNPDWTIFIRRWSAASGDEEPSTRPPTHRLSSQRKLGPISPLAQG